MLSGSRLFHLAFVRQSVLIGWICIPIVRLAEFVQVVCRPLCDCGDDQFTKVAGIGAEVNSASEVLEHRFLRALHPHMQFVVSRGDVAQMKCSMRIRNCMERR